MKYWFLSISSKTFKIKPWETVEALQLKTKYHKQDITNTNHLQYGAGIPPFIRGPYASMYCEKKWTIESLFFARGGKFSGLPAENNWF